MATTTTNFGFDVPTSSDLVKNGATQIALLGQDIDTFLAQAPTYTAGKNFCINGNQAIAQRGTSVSGVTSSTYLTDRFDLNLTTMGTWTMTQESDAPTGFSKSLKVLVTTADASPASADRVRIIYKNEGTAVQSLSYGSASAKTVTFSFWVKSNVTGTYVLELFNFGPSANRHIASTYTVSASATWEKKTITFAGDTVSTIVADNIERLSAIFYLGAGSDFTSGTLATAWANNVSANRAVGQTNVAAAINNYFQITGVQMEIGSSATPFQTASGGSPQAELAMCQRYYYRLTADTTYAYLAFGMATSTTNGKVSVPAPSTMRVVPTAIDSPTASTLRFTDGVTGTTCNSSPTLDGDTTNELLTFNIGVASGLTQYRPIWFGANNSSSAYVGFSAEL